MCDMKKEKLSDKVAARILKDIAARKYKVGEKIPPEPELMQLYGVGRSSVREAIKSLAMAGKLLVKQGDGTYVNDDSDAVPLNQQLRNADFDEINAVRRLLEEEIVKLAADHHSAGDLKKMEKALASRKAAILREDRKACTDADIAFHMAIAQASGNKVLADLYQRFTQTIRTFFAQREPNGIGHFAMSHPLHEDLFKAIGSRNKQHALEITRHILNNNY